MSDTTPTSPTVTPLDPANANPGCTVEFCGNQATIMVTDTAGANTFRCEMHWAQDEAAAAPPVPAPPDEPDADEPPPPVPAEPPSVTTPPATIPVDPSPPLTP